MKMNKTTCFAITMSTLMISLSCNDVDMIDPIPSSTITPSTDVKELSLADPKATEETKALYSNLWMMEFQGFMFGHHEDLAYGRYWYGEEGGSDTKAVCGDYPAVFSVDLAEVMDDRATIAESQEFNALNKHCIEEARSRGEVIVACAHLNNPLTGGDAWDNSNGTVVKEILSSGSDTQKTFTSWLDRLVVFLKNLNDDKGHPIPIVFRPFHEHNQTWSWWGNGCTTEEEFISLWRFTVDYLRNAGIHQLIYAISPQMDTQKAEDDFLYRWPGDDYVDFIGMDSYHGLDPTVFSVNMKMMASVAARKRKPCGVTETGVEGFDDDKYWTEEILTPAQGRFISMIVMWRNKYVASEENDTHFFSVYPGHPSEKDFVSFYQNSITFFSEDLPNMYTIANGMTVN